MNNYLFATPFLFCVLFVIFGQRKQHPTLIYLSSFVCIGTVSFALLYGMTYEHAVSILVFFFLINMEAHKYEL